MVRKLFNRFTGWVDSLGEDAGPNLLGGMVVGAMVFGVLLIGAALVTQSVSLLATGLVVVAAHAIYLVVI